MILAGNPDQVRQRLEDRLCVVGDVWFPTRAEMKRWDVSPAPLYVKWTRRGGFEIGPRLDTIPAARLVPVLRGRLTEDDGGSVVVSATMAWPRLTRLVLLGFGLSLLIWGIYVISQYVTGDTHLGWVGAWAVTVLSVHGGATVAWFWGRTRLRSDLPWLEGVLATPSVAGEDWED